MTDPVQRPRRPPVLIAALVLLPLAAMWFTMTTVNLGGSGSTATTLPMATVWISVLAIRFNWARAASVALLAFLTVTWIPGAVRNMGDPELQQAAIYVVLGTVFFVTGAVMVYTPTSNRYYGEAAQWRTSRKQRSV